MGKKLYGVYSSEVKGRDRYKIPNFCRMKKYSTKEKALKHTDKRFDDRIYSLSLIKVRRMC